MAGKKKKQSKKNKYKPADNKFSASTSSAKAETISNSSASDDESSMRQETRSVASTSSPSPSLKGSVQRGNTVLKSMAMAEIKPDSSSNQEEILIQEQEITKAASALPKKGYYLSPETMFPFMSGVETGARQVKHICESMKVFKFMLLDGELRIVMTVLLDRMKMLQEDYQILSEGLMGAVGVFVPDATDVRQAASDFVNQYVLPPPSVQQNHSDDEDPPYPYRQSSELQISASLSHQILSTSTSETQSSSTAFASSMSNNPRQRRSRGGYRRRTRSSTTRSRDVTQLIQEEMVEPLLASINVAICMLSVLEEWMQQAVKELESDELKDWVSEVLHLMKENLETYEKAEELVLRRGIRSATGSSFSASTLKLSANARRSLRLLDFFRWMAAR